MPPKKSQQPKEKETKSNGSAKTGQKRKSPVDDSTTKSEKPEKKVPRQGSRSSSRTTTTINSKPNKENTSTKATPKQILNHLLSSASLPLCYPSSELEAANSTDFKRTYSLTPPSSFTPFEHLLTAHLLSKPLSHTLGMRSTRVLLNAPYDFHSACAVKTAGETRIHTALDAARTQHRQKTASYIAQMADTYADATGSSDDSDAMLDLAVAANEGGAHATIAHVKSSVKGMGQVGAEIFCRRVQCVAGWGDALWPYADPKALDAVSQCLGVVLEDADELQEAIERDVDWDKVGDMGLRPKLVELDDGQQVQVEFVVLLERAVGCVLEGNVMDLQKAAAEWS